MKIRENGDKSKADGGAGFPSCNVWRWNQDIKKSWHKENRSFWELVLAKNVEDFMDRKANQHVDTAAVENHNIIGEQNKKK
jgi:hypothetical protein